MKYELVEVTVYEGEGELVIRSLTDLLKMMKAIKDIREELPPNYLPFVKLYKEKDDGTVQSS